MTEPKGPYVKGENAVWTHFWDMHSGGSTKEPPYESIYIQAPLDEAKVIFYNRFGHNPERVSCTCCGDDYSISESPSLEEASGYHRNCAYAWFDAQGNEMPEEWDPRSLDPHRLYGAARDQGYEQRIVERADPMKASYGHGLLTLHEYEAQDNVLIIGADEITPDERHGSIPEQGYVWVE